MATAAQWAGPADPPELLALGDLGDSLRDLMVVLLARCQSGRQQGQPSARGQTLLGAGVDQLDPSRGVARPEDIEYLGKPLSEEKLLQIQKDSPGEIIVWHYYRLPRDQAYLDLAVLYAGGIIASDAVALDAFMDAIEQAQSIDRPTVREIAAEQFDTKCIVKDVILALKVACAAANIETKDPLQSLPEGYIARSRE